MLRIRPAYAASTAGPDEPHVAGQDDDVGPGAARAPRPGPSSSPPATRAVSIPCSAAQSSAGHARSAKTSTISPPSSPRAAAACSARRFEPAPDTPTAIRPPLTRSTPAHLPRSGRHRARRRRPTSPTTAAVDAVLGERGRSRRRRPPAAATATIPSPPLNVARSSSSSRPPSAPSRRMTDGIRQRSGSRRAPSPSGSARGTFPGSPPPVMWARPWRSCPAATTAARAARTARA